MSRTVSLSTAQMAAILAVVIAVSGIGAVVLADVAPTDRPESDTTTGPEEPAVSTFDSAGEFRSYLRSADQSDRALRAGSSGAEADGGADSAATDDAPRATDTQMEAPQSTPVLDESSARAAKGDDSGERRASDTNVQIGSVDEPDVLKTTPQTVYYSPRDRNLVVREPGEDADDPPDREAGVRLINASDPAAPEVASRLDVSGKLLLAGDTLVVFDGDTLVGYDVSDREDPERTWSRELSSRVVTARLHADTVYLVTADGVDRREPCPVEPMDGVSVPCTEIHHPAEPTAVDTTYTVTLLDPADGSVDDSASFVGSGGNTVVHVSPGTVHVTYPQRVDRAEVMARFLLENQSDRLDDETLDRIEEIQGYDLGPRAKRIELRRAVSNWLAGLPESERREAERKLSEDRRAWAAENKRQFHRTGIVAFDVTGVDGESPTVEAGATGSVPGRPLDQFSMDVDDGEFRIATTIPGAMGTDSENDLYVLDESLEVTGSVTGMGVTERIYSVRYVGDEAYVVTFRRIDPFHVVDLSDPEDPTLEGELKLPGFSSYLHPLPGDRVLGIGEEDGKVKLVVFDVSEPSNPTIETDRILDAQFSAVADSHHAFLMDRRHGVFFLPAGETAYVFNYTDGLSVETTVATGDRVQRTAYVGDYLYVFDDDSVTVVNEQDWQRTSEVPLAE